MVAAVIMIILIAIEFVTIKIMDAVNVLDITIGLANVRISVNLLCAMYFIILIVFTILASQNICIKSFILEKVKCNKSNKTHKRFQIFTKY